MEQKKASELQVGDVFCRASTGAKPRSESIYTVQRLQCVPIHDFFGGTCDTIQVSAINRLLGPQNVSLSADEPIWLLDLSAPGVLAAPTDPPDRRRRKASWFRR